MPSPSCYHDTIILNRVGKKDEVCSPRISVIPTDLPSEFKWLLIPSEDLLCHDYQQGTRTISQDWPQADFFILLL